MRSVPAALRVALAVVIVALLGGVGAPASAESRGQLSVSAEGVSFDPDRVEDGDVVYMVRSLDDAEDGGGYTEWIRQDIDRVDVRAGYVAFEEARWEMPDGYCVVFVRVPGAGEWSENPGSTACTSDASASPSQPQPRPTRSPTRTPTQTATPSAASTPSPSASATPSASPSASPSTSPSPKPSKASRSPSPDVMRIQGEALTRSFSGELPESAAGPSREQAQGGGLVALGLIVAALTMTAVGGVVWWQRRG